MKISSISDMKQQAASLHSNLGFKPMFVTQNGRQSLVIQTIESYDSEQGKIKALEAMIDEELSR